MLLLILHLHSFKKIIILSISKNAVHIFSFKNTSKQTSTPLSTCIFSDVLLSTLARMHSQVGKSQKGQNHKLQETVFPFFSKLTSFRL